MKIRYHKLILSLSITAAVRHHADNSYVENIHLFVSY